MEWVWQAFAPKQQFLIFLRDRGLELTETLVQCSPPSEKNQEDRARMSQEVSK